MREIKYRAWDKREKTWWLGSAIYLNSIPNERHTFGILEGVSEHLELLQFTGLKDKNGKEIYEGDITNDGVVEWSRILLAWIVARKDEHSHEHDFLCTIENPEIIGNIYENPELLKN